jgi:hypothetical protein
MTRTVETAQSDFPFIIFKEVATLPWPGIGMYRARYWAGTELYGEWSDKNAQEQIDRNGLPGRYERVTRATWEAAQAGEMHGWCEESDPEAFVYAEPLTEEACAVWNEIKRQTGRTGR